MKNHPPMRKSGTLFFNLEISGIGAWFLTESCDKRKYRRGRERIESKFSFSLSRTCKWSNLYILELSKSCSLLFLLSTNILADLSIRRSLLMWPPYMFWCMFTSSVVNYLFVFSYNDIIYFICSQEPPLPFVIKSGSLGNTYKTTSAMHHESWGFTSAAIEVMAGPCHHFYVSRCELWVMTQFYEIVPVQLLVTLILFSQF
jgi:hypothetical protein